MKRIFLCINFWSIINVTFTLTLVFFIHIYFFSSGSSMDTCNKRHTRSFILLVFRISCPLPTRSRAWRWWFLGVKCISHSYWFLISVWNKKLLAFNLEEAFHQKLWSCTTSKQRRGYQHYEEEHWKNAHISLYFQKWMQILH